MNENVENEITTFFEKNRDDTYKAFQSKLIPSIATEAIIGVRTPQLRLLARKLVKHPYIGHFLAALPHETFEENQLHAFILGQSSDYDAYIKGLQAFLPYLDNWATCDQLPIHILAEKPTETLARVQEWIADERPYVARFGIGVLLREFLDDKFNPQHMQWIAAKASKDYYVNMMRAWYVAEALTKQPESALDLLKTRKLDIWTHNKAIQKARESRRISKELKSYLKILCRD